MALVKASSLPKVERTPELYISSRINDAATKGYNSTLIWTYNKDRDAIKVLLNEGGYSYTIRSEDLERETTQLEVSW